MSEVVVGIDLGGTHLRAAAAGLAGGDTAERLDARAAPGSVDDLVGAIAAAVSRLTGGAAPARLALTIPGLVAGTRARWVPNLAYLDGVDLAAALGGVAQQVVVLNDAHAALLAESIDGAAAGVGNAILLAVGTGIGSAVLADGRIVRGSSGAACSFGWACADLDDPGSDRHGWLERQASGTAFDVLADRWSSGAMGADLVGAARRGDTAARAALGSPARALGTALAGAVALLAPSVVVVSGGVAEALDVLAAELCRALARQLPGHLRDIPVISGHHGSDAALFGALAAARRGTRWWEAS